MLECRKPYILGSSVALGRDPMDHGRRNQRSGVVVTDEWALGVVACRIGWVVIAFGAEGQAARDPQLSRRLWDGAWG
jgi:hypothetical protein